MARVGRKKHIFKVSFEDSGEAPSPGAPVPWRDEFAASAVGDFKWAAAAMQMSESYLRLRMSVTRMGTGTLDNLVVFKGCLVRAVMRRIG